MYISNLAKYKLLHKESRKYEGYRLTYLGYDFLAIHSLVKKGVINSVGRQIGVGKESDVFEVSKLLHHSPSCKLSRKESMLLYQAACMVITAVIMNE